jgi:DNA-binding transcriptional MerR regulator
VLPSPRRSASGYRLYDQPGVELLRFIRAMGGDPAEEEVSIVMFGRF